MARSIMPGDAVKVKKNLGKDKQPHDASVLQPLPPYDFQGPVMATVMPGPCILTK